MKNILWLATLVIAFISGYFFHGNGEKNILPKPEAVATTQNAQPAVAPNCEPRVAEVIAHDHSQPVKPKQPIKAVQDSSTAAVEMAKTTKADSAAEAIAPASSSSPISDAIIDKILPAPFNEIIKKSNANDKDIYKKFAEASEPQDWDIKMQNKLNDAIFSSPHANALTIDSLVCKGNICEVRVFEHRNGAWSLIMADMKLQSWWEFGPTSNYGFGMMKDDKLVTGNIALFVRQ